MAMLRTVLQRHKTSSGIAVGVLVCYFLYCTLLPDGFSGYEEVSTTKISTPYCEARFGHDYLDQFQETRAEYCTPDSKSGLTCFSNNVDPSGGRTDSFCIGYSTFYNQERKKFQLDCNFTELSPQQVDRGVQPLSRFPAYWYSTGPRYLLNSFVQLGKQDAIPAIEDISGLPTTILIKREDANFNLWHSLMEVMSVAFSLQIIFATLPPADQHILNPDNVQLVFLDTIPYGPYGSLWNMFTTHSFSRSTSLDILPQTNLILPLPGGSNPLWQCDWTYLSCHSSPLLTHFTTSILKQYGIQSPSPQPANPLRLTFINRVTKRRLLNQTSLLTRLSSQIPDIRLLSLDFASLPFSAQIQHATETDVLIGVHGAGMTHSIFMPSAAAVVEFMPKQIDHQGFRNVASMLGLGYHRAEAVSVRAEGGMGDWQEDDVMVQEEVFVRTVMDAGEGVRRRRRAGV